jgi:hypothetical protein
MRVIEKKIYEIPIESDELLTPEEIRKMIDSSQSLRSYDKLVEQDIDTSILYYDKENG